MTCPNCRWHSTGTNDRFCEMKRLLRMSANYRDATPGRGDVTGLLHALRTAGQARESELHEDLEIIGLVHDLARPLNDVHHGEIIAEIMRDRVSELAYDVLRTHGAFQAAYMRQQPWPEVLSPAALAVAIQLAGYEVKSFSASFTGPSLKLVEADALLWKYLG